MTRLQCPETKGWFPKLVVAFAVCEGELEGAIIAAFPFCLFWWWKNLSQLASDYPHHSWAKALPTA